MIDIAKEHAIAPSEAAKLLGVKTRTIYKYFDANLTSPPLESFDLGGRQKRTTKEAVQRFVNARQSSVQPAPPPLFQTTRDHEQDRLALRQEHGI